MSTLLVTGGAGFIGSHLVTALAQRGDRVRVIDDFSTGRRENLAHLELGGPGSGAPVEVFEGDLAAPGVAEAALEGVGGVLHEAAQVSVPQSLEDPVRSYEVNVMGTLRVLQAARRHGVRSVVLAASSAAYGDDAVLPAEESARPSPLSPYASGKLAAEELLAVWGRAFDLRTVALRYFNVYGPRQADDSPYSGVIALFARALLTGAPVTIFGDGLQTRDFVYVADVVRANLAALEAADLDPGEVINVGTGSAVSLNELFAELRSLAGSGATPDHAPPRPGDVRHSRASIERARRLLAFEPGIPLREGLAQTLAWYRERLG